MRRIRRTVIRCSRLAGPVLGLAITVCVCGLGLHAAHDWHRHGGFGAGIFHLHFHAGEHVHDSPTHDDHDHEAPANEQQQRTAFLTIAQAFLRDASVTPSVTLQENGRDRTPIDCLVLRRSTRPAAFANPRAPPA